jgi:hypothetical protein
VVSSADRTVVRLLAAGALLGLAVVVEYPLAIVALAIVAYLFLRGEGLRVAWVVLGGLPAAVALAVYQAAAFGSPLASSYQEKGEGGGPPLEFNLPPDPGFVVKILVGTRGLIWTPIVLVAVIAAVVVLRDRIHPARDHAGMGLAMFVAFLLLQASWVNPWGGEVSFPRYLVSALPFLVVPLAVVWTRWRTVALAATAIGLVRVLPPLLIVVVQPHGAGFVGWYRDALDTYGAAPTLAGVAVGPAGWLLHVAAFGAIAYLLARAVRRERVAGACEGGSPSPTSSVRN